MKTGVLLINLGTPDAPEPGAVRRYLKQFLSDERVLDINPIGRWLLLNLIICRFDLDAPPKPIARFGCQKARHCWCMGSS